MGLAGGRALGEWIRERLLSDDYSTTLYSPPDEWVVERGTVSRKAAEMKQATSLLKDLAQKVPGLVSAASLPPNPKPPPTGIVMDWPHTDENGRPLLRCKNTRCGTLRQQALVGGQCPDCTWGPMLLPTSHFIGRCGHPWERGAQTCWAGCE